MLQPHLLDSPPPQPQLSHAPRMPLARDMARVFAAKRMMQKRPDGVGHDDYGRAAQSAWVANYTNIPSRDVDIQQTAQWTYCLTPPDAGSRTLHYIHGGGLVHYAAADFLPMLSHLAARAGQRVMLHSYPHLPETAADDCLTPLIARVVAALDPSQGDIVMGDSIGGLLALLIAVGPAAGKIHSAALIYPVLSLEVVFPSYADFGQAHGLDTDTMLWFRSLWADWFKAHGPDPLTIPKAPCPVTVFAAPCDILADEAHVFAQRTADVTLHWLKGQPHDCLLYAGRVASADQALSQISAHLACL